MKESLQEIWLWIIAIVECTYDICRYGLQGAEERTLDKTIELRKEIEAIMKKLEEEEA